MTLTGRNMKKTKQEKVIKLDIGCGKNKVSPDFIGVDQYAMNGVDVVCDLTKTWMWDDNSVDEIHCSHFLEHLTNNENKYERIHFFNEMYRVLKVGGKVTLIFPHWCSNRYYGDPTHREPFSEMGFYYLNKEWRMQEAPHTDIEFNANGYKCNLSASWGYTTNPALQNRNEEYKNFALQNYKESAMDIISTLIKL